MKQNLFHIVFYLCCFCVNIISAQTYNFQYFTVENGLSQSEITCIYEDTRGFLWLGTAGGGINMFDGINFKSYEEKDGLSGSIITALEEDNEGNLWIGTTWGGVNKFNGRTIKYFNRESGLLDNYISSIVTDNDGKVWVGSHKGICVFNGVEFTHLTEKNGLKTGDVNYLFKDLSGRIWIAGNQGLQFYENKKLNLVNLNGIDSNIRFLEQDIEGNIWFYNASGKVYFINKENEIIPFSFNYLFNNSGISSMHCDNEGNLWIATTDFWIIRYYKDEIEIFTTDNGVPKIPIVSMYKDRSGNLWLGTQGYGLVKYTNTPFTYFEKFDGLNSPSIFNIVQDSKGDIWVASVIDGLTKFDGKKVTRWNTVGQLPSITIYGLSIDKNDVLWMATKEGLCKFDGKKITTYTTKNGLPTNKIRSVLSDSKGNVWVGTSGHGLYKLTDENSFIKVSDKEGLDKQSIHCIFEDKNQNIWCGTGLGAYKISKDNISLYSVAQGLCNSYIGSITQDKNGKIWFSTDRCIASYDGIKIKTFDQKQGLTSNTIYLIQFDNEGNLWVGTNKGLDKISFSTYGQIQNIKHYSKPEGFIGIECNTRSVMKDKDGNLYFGTIKGLTKYTPNLDKPDLVEPDLHITNINLFYEPTDWKQFAKNVTPWFQLPQNLVLPYDKNHLTFEFKAITKTSPEKTVYSFILEGFDEQWSPYSTQSFVTYPKIPPGKYTFKVKACNSSNICTKQPLTFTFWVSAPFWKTTWFYLLIILSLIFIVIRIIQYRERKQKAIEEALEKTVAERTQEIKKQKEQIEVLLKEIHHRVKNNLQIINSLINLQSCYVNDEQVQEMFKEARNRIITMALIHEKLYESKDLTNINLKQYLSKLIDYLKSSYILNKEVAIKTKIEEIKLNIDTVIPLGILINEIVSNSLKYAFDDNAVNPEIEIIISKKQDEYELIAGDNGKGFDKKLFYNETNTLGLELIKMLSEQLNGSVKILDKPGTWYHIKFKGIS